MTSHIFFVLIFFTHFLSFNPDSEHCQLLTFLVTQIFQPCLYSRIFFLTTWNVFQHWCDFIKNRFCQKSLFNFIAKLPARQHWWFSFGVVSTYCWVLQSKEADVPFLQFDVLVHSDLLIFLFLKSNKSCVKPDCQVCIFPLLFWTFRNFLNNRLHLTQFCWKCQFTSCGTVPSLHCKWALKFSQLTLSMLVC